MGVKYLHQISSNLLLLEVKNYCLYVPEFCYVNPTNNALSTSFLLSSDAESFVNKHRLSLQIGACKKKVYAMGI